MTLHVQAVAETDNSTLSVLYHEGRFLCFVLEDGHRLEKVKHETRIWPGVYQVRRRMHGGFFEKYSKLYGHRYAIELLNVPLFEDILIHIGNNVRDTSGCLLVGLGCSSNGKDFAISQSQAAYIRVYDIVEAAFARGEQVQVRISREIVQNAA